MNNTKKSFENYYKKQTTENLQAYMKINKHTCKFIMLYANHETLCKSIQILNTYANLRKSMQILEIRKLYEIV